MMSHSDYAKLILRAMVGGLMLFHGEFKLLNGIARIVERIEALHLPGMLAYLVFLGEIVAPLMLIIGLWTRIAASIVAGNMIVAVLLVHASQLVSRSDNGGYLLELQAFYFFSACAIALFGAGRFSVGGINGKWN